MGLELKITADNIIDFEERVLEIAGIFSDRIVTFPAEDDPPGDQVGDGTTQDTSEDDANASELTRLLADSAGRPWNAEIHSPKQTKKADGTWTIKRGADKMRVAAINAELEAASKAELDATTTVAAPAQQTLPADPLGPAPASTAPSSDPVADCIAMASKCLATGTGNAERTAAISARINTIMSDAGLEGSAALIQNPDKAPAVLVALQALAVECEQ